MWLLQTGSPSQNLLVPIILMVVIFYLVLFLPMRRRQKKLESMLSELKNGDRVVTSGGLVGTVVGLGDDNSVTIRIKPDNVKLQFARSAVTSVLNEEEEKK
ncbi:MAG: preprotein translocase subunit YajC [Bryobacterales bacterium]